MAATADDLFLAILSLDSYNRGYGVGMADVSGNQLGTATITSQGFTETQKAAGFYATAYSWNGHTVISYRGTSFVGSPDPSDVIQGWTLSAGDITAWQPRLAEQFYNQVVNPDVFSGTAPSNVILTGHSLGGGLAGFISLLTGAPAEIFNTIAIGISASANDNAALSAYARAG
jgi:fermentation-respiration switch protein FrsA (DUF1100 family)